MQWDCPVQGIFVGRVDPAQVGTAAGIVAATRQKAPDSSWPAFGSERTAEPVGTERLALAGRPGFPGMFLAYESNANDIWRVLLWQVGALAPVEVWRGRDRPFSIQVAAEPTSGRLWVVWDDGGRLRIRRTNADATGFDGPARAIARPSDATPRLGDYSPWDVSVRDGALDVVFGIRADDEAPGGVWITTLEA
jgi:hypothetical protein